MGLDDLSVLGDGILIALGGLVEVHHAGGIVARDVTFDRVEDTAQPLVRFFDRQMDGGEWHIEKERGRAARFDPADGFGGEQVGDVARFFEPLFVAMPRLRERTLFVAMIPRADSARE